jgi:hypothetical protein
MWEGKDVPISRFASAVKRHNLAREHSPHLPLRIPLPRNRYIYVRHYASVYVYSILQVLLHALRLRSPLFQYLGLSSLRSP